MRKFFLDLHPVFYMMISVASYSFFPVLFTLGGAKESPILFTAIYLGGSGVFLGAATLFVKRKLLLRREVIEDVKSQCKTRLMLVSIVGYGGFFLFALGLSFVDVSIAAILLETWPLFLIILVAFLFKDSRRYVRLSFSTLIFVFLSLFGVAFVILSHNDAPQPILAILAIKDDFADPRTLLGVLLVLGAAVFTATKGVTFKMGNLLAKKHAHKKDKRTEEIVFALVMTCIGKIIASTVLCVIGLAVSETISLHQLSYALMNGVVVTSFGTVAFRAANLKTKDLGVNALSYATPLITLMWLWMLSILNVSHLDYLIIGAMGIIASNLLINVDASERVAYKALIVSLWVFGTITYFTEGYATKIPLELPVTIFILVLSFRVERLARRTTQEEGWVFDVFRRLRYMASKTEPRTEKCKALLLASKALLNVDHHKSAAALKDAYEDTLGYLEKARRAGIDAEEITELCRMVDKVAHSRQQGSRFGEIVAIALVGLLIVLGLLVFNGEREIYGEIVSFVLPSVVVFLFFNIVDLQGDRKDETLVTGKMGRYIVNFGKVKDREIQQYVSMVTSGVIVIVFVCLYIAKG